MIRTLGFLACLLLVACGSGSSHKTPAKPTPAEPAEPVASDPAPPEPSPEAPAAAPAASRTLYQRLGETPAITLVVEEFVGRTTTDPRIKERFFNTDAVNLKRLLVEFVCQATGGPCKYTGRDMVSSHAGMDLVDEEFNALVDNLSGALDKYKVPDREKNELLGALGPLKPQIVASPDKLHPIDDAQLARAEKVAAKRGQRSYAEQLFSRAEMMTGPKPLNPIANVFRAGAPQRVASPLKKLPSDTPAQPRTAGGSETDEPDRRPAAGSLHGSIRIDGKTPSGLGVVMLWPERGGKKRVAKQRIIEQRGKMFAPHVMAVPVGSTVSFPNFDPIFHNVFSLSKAKAFDLGMYKNGETRDVKLEKPGIVRLGCNLHANMSAYLIVVDAPHYVVVEEDGSYSFKSLAPGKYRVQAWNEQSGDPVTKTVTINAGTNESDIDLKGGGLAISPDKFGTARQ